MTDDDLLHYYELGDEAVAESLFALVAVQWASARTLPNTLEELPQPPATYVVTVRQFLITIAPVLVYGLVTTPTYVMAVDAVFGDSLPVVLVSGIVGCGMHLVLGWLVLLPLGDWLAGVPLVVEGG